MLSDLFEPNKNIHCSCLFLCAWKASEKCHRLLQPLINSEMIEDKQCNEIFFPFLVHDDAVVFCYLIVVGVSIAVQLSNLLWVH